MKNDRLVRALDDAAAFRARLVLLCCVYAAGGLLGMLAYRGVTQDSAVQLQDYIRHFAVLSTDTAEPAAALISVLVVYFRYPVLVYLAGFAAVGLLIVPGICLVQGFSLAFAVCCFIGALGRDGLLLALVAFGLRSFCTLACTLCLAVSSMGRAYARLGAGGKKGKRQATTAQVAWQPVFCLVALLLGVAAELCMVPRLLQLALARIS